MKNNNNKIRNFVINGNKTGVIEIARNGEWAVNLVRLEEDTIELHTVATYKGEDAVTFYGQGDNNSNIFIAEKEWFKDKLNEAIWVNWMNDQTSDVIGLLDELEEEVTKSAEEANAGIADIDEDDDIDEYNNNCCKEAIENAMDGLWNDRFNYGWEVIGNGLNDYLTEVFNNTYFNDEMTDEEYARLFMSSKDFAMETIREAFSTDTVGDMIDALMLGINEIYSKEQQRELNPMVANMMAWELMCRQGEGVIDRDGIFDGLYDNAVEAFEISEEDEPHFQVKFACSLELAKAKLNSICAISE